jgi:hypothetical protein
MGLQVLSRTDMISMSVIPGEDIPLSKEATKPYLIQENIQGFGGGEGFFSLLGRFCSSIRRC